MQSDLYILIRYFYHKIYNFIIDITNNIRKDNNNNNTHRQNIQYTLFTHSIVYSRIYAISFSSFVLTIKIKVSHIISLFNLFVMIM